MSRDLLAQLWIAWQPIKDLADGVSVGYEALIRGPADSPWAMPSGLFGWAEREGHAQELEEVCRSTALTWAQHEWPPGQYLFLNVDGRWPQLPNPWDDRTVDGIPLVLEFSERQSLLDNQGLLRAMARWRQAGHLLALDDYGTGYAAAATVLAIQPHIIKLDRALISGIEGNAGKRSLVRALRAWTRDLDIRLVAEGIETESELAVLQDLGCDYGQGYLLGRPAPELRSDRPSLMPVRKSVGPDGAPSSEAVLAFYAAAIRESSIPTYVVDTRRHMVAWNGAAEQLLGYPEDALVGHACFRSPLDHQNQAGHRLCVGACPLVHAMAERTVLTERISVRTRAGSRRVIDVSVIPLLDGGTGRVVGALEQFRLAPGWGAGEAPDAAETLVDLSGPVGPSVPDPHRLSQTTGV
ncbi:MAG: EAL domain-containing protein [Clostridia bacterium]